jgi:hypothetical protein
VRAADRQDIAQGLLEASGRLLGVEVATKNKDLKEKVRRVKELVYTLEKQVEEGEFG